MSSIKIMKRFFSNAQNARQNIIIAAVFVGMVLTSGMAGEITVHVNPTMIPTSYILGILWFLVLVVVLLALHHQRNTLDVLFKSNPFYWLALLLAITSLTWSANPVWSIRSLAMLFTTFCIAAVLAVYIKRETAYLMIHCLLGFAIVGSIAVAVFYPDMGVQRAGWRGLFGGRSWLGNAAALWGVLCFCLLLQARSFRVFAFTAAATLISIYVLVKTGSASAKVSYFVGLYVCAGFFLVNKRYLRFSTFVIVSTALAITAFVMQDAIYEILGRNMRWAGRTDVVWPALWPLMLERPLLGYGYDAWLHADGVLERLPERWAPKAVAGADVHHGLIRLQLDIGILGVALVLAMFIQLFWRATRWVLSSELTILRLSAVGIWVVIIVNQMTEPSIFMPVSLTVLLLVYTAYVTYTFNGMLVWDKAD